MAELETILEGWDTGLFELKIALEGIPQVDLWRRPHPNLLSIGEIAGHIAYGLVANVFGAMNERSDLAGCPIVSPLLNESFRYFSTNHEAPVVLKLDVESVIAEIEKVFDASRLEVTQHQSDELVLSHWKTWGALANYQAFHIAYHTGQIYTARHIFGHKTEDN